MIDSGRFGSNSPAWIPPFSHKRRSKEETFFSFANRFMFNIFAD
jgi:hypothetical protein